MKPISLWMRGVGLFVAILLCLPVPVWSQQGADSAEKQLSKEELAQLLAPIALYPDELVSQILMASTYPLEVVQADRWARATSKAKATRWPSSSRRRPGTQASNHWSIFPRCSPR